MRHEKNPNSLSSAIKEKKKKSALRLEYKFCVCGGLVDFFLAAIITLPFKKKMSFKSKGHCPGEQSY